MDKPPHNGGRVKVAKDLRADVNALLAAGWTLTVGGRHTKLTCPAGHHRIPVPAKDGGIVPAWRTKIRRHADSCP